MTRFLAIVLLSFAVILGWAGASTAFANGPDLVVNGVLAIHFARSNGDLSPEARAITAAHRIKRLPYWGQVGVKGDGTTRDVTIGPDSVLSVTPADAALANTTVSSLAATWAAKLQDAMNLPPLRVSDNFVNLAVGRTRLISVIGSSSAKATASSGDKTIATVTKTAGGFAIKGMGLGQTIVSVMSGALQENVQVTIQPLAADFPQNFAVGVTGTPANVDTVKGAAEMALKTRMQALPDAKVTFSSTTFSSLDVDKSATYTFQVTATSPSGITNKGQATVTVNNMGWPAKNDDFLWYSNKPETVKHPQSLFSDNLKRGEAVRLLYHHVNGTQDDLFLRVEIVNDSKMAAEVAVMPGDSKPDVDPVNAGIQAACQFVRGWISGSAEIVTIPPGAVLPISLRRLSPGITGSGLCDLRLMSGPDSLLVRTDCLPPIQLDDKWMGALYTSTPWHEVGTHPMNMYDDIPCQADPHVYADPYQVNSFTYTVGGRHGFYRIGSKPLSQVDQGGSLDGNYGVFETLETTLVNPTQAAQDVELVFESSAGYAGGVFIVNGEFQLVRQMKPNTEARIGKFHLNPGDSLKVPVITLPLSGSSYPATIIARPVLQF